MLKKIKRGAKKVMEKNIELGKAVIKGLTSTKNRTNIGIIGGLLCIGFVLSSYLENGCHLYPK